MEVIKPFPEQGLLPKGETQATDFLAAHPSYDGRNVLVAIFDTGCDPGASGLAVTSDGKPKYVDFIDASGSGDVDTSVEVEAKPAASDDSNDKSTTKGGDNSGAVRFTSPVTQRELTVPTSVAATNPSGRWRVGCKRAFELYPAPLVERMKKERKQVFDEAQRRLEQELQARLASFDEDAKPAGAASAAASASSPASPPSAPVASAAGSYPPTYGPKDKADLEARLAEVRAVSKAYDDCGPVFDVLVWHDGREVETAATSSPASGGVLDRRERGWWAMVDSTGTGNFTGQRPLTNYAHGGGFSTFSGVDLMNYTVNIYQRGKVLNIVTTAGNHGTHVAGIVAAYEGGAGGLGSQHNGLAPGAQLVSIKIGDSRLGSMETGVGLARGLIEAIRMKVDVINMSYGEASKIPNSGRISELIRSAVYDHGIVFVSSAGNNGPALSSSGSPGSTDQGVISVGAYVSPSMSLACYSSRRGVPENMYSWSSRGPTTDGAQGVCISACGGAVTSVCEWQLQKTQLMNGTSMSSPAAAGGIALLLSGLRARGLSWTPQRIKHAIEVTARAVPGIEQLSQGHGLLQIEAAFDHLITHAARSDLDLFYKVTLPATGARGIYLRDAADTARAYECSVSVEPVFKEQRIDQAWPEQAAASAGSASAGGEEKDSGNDASASPVASSSPQASASSSSPPAAHPGNYALNKARSAYHQKVALTCAAAWVNIPDHVMLMHGGRSFGVVVHGETLTPGLHFSEILGYDATLAAGERAKLGPLFRIPVTVLRPEDPATAHSALVAQAIQGGGAGDLAAVGMQGASYKFNNLPCDSGKVHRRFVVVPEGASYVDFTVRLHSLEAAGAASDAADGAPQANASGGSDEQTSRSFMLHALFLNPEEAYSAHENNTFFALTADSPVKELRMDVRPGATMEVALAQYWSALGACRADVEVSFGGVLVEGAPNGELVLDASAPFTPVAYRNVLRTTKLAPSASLKVWCQPLRPISSTIVQLSRERDFIERGARLISALQLTYSFELKDDSSCVKVRAPALNDYLYESVFESQLTSIFDANKRFCFATDAFESGKALKAGKYTARIQVRHDDLSLLERVKDLSVVVEITLGKSIDLPAYASYTQAAVGGSKFGAAKSIKPGKAGILYLGVESKPFPSFAKPGDWGQGTLTIAKGEFGGEKGGSVKLKVYAPAAAPPAEKTASATGAVPAATAGASKKDAKPAEGEQDPAFPRLEQKDPASSPTGAEPTSSPTPAGASSSSASASSSSSSSSNPSSLATELRDMTIKALEGLKKDGDNDKKAEALKTVLPPLLAAFPTHLPLLFLELRLSHELNASRPRGSADRDDAGVAEKAQALLTKHVDQTALLAHFGRVVDKDSPADVQATRKEKEEVRRTVVRTLAMQLEAAADELRAFTEQIKAVEYQPSAQRALDAAASASEAASPSPAGFAQALASFHTLLSDAGSWVDVSKGEWKKVFSPHQLLATKIARHYGALWKQLGAEATAAATGGDGALQKALLQERIDLLESLARVEPLYAHIVEHEKTALLTKFPKDYAPW